MSVSLDVGGVIYKTSLTTLTSQADSFFSRMFSGDWQNIKDEHGNIFIDRDGEIFKHVLQYLRNGPNTILPGSENLRNQIRCEAQFYCLPDLDALIDSISDFRTLTLRFCSSHSGGNEKMCVLNNMRLGYLRSEPLSYNITNNTLEKDECARLVEDGSYCLAVGGIVDDDEKCAEHAAIVKMAKVLRVQVAVEHATELVKEKQSKQVNVGDEDDDYINEVEDVYLNWE